MKKLPYLFRDQFTGVVKAYKAMTLAEASTANTLLSQAASDCRWFANPLPTDVTYAKVKLANSKRYDRTALRRAADETKRIRGDAHQAHAGLFRRRT